MDEIARVRIVCLARASQAATALRVRQRLERVARSGLGRALERTLAGTLEPDRAVALERLTVQLDLDPDDYDDETLAILWASRIREAILAGDRARAPGARAAPGMRDRDESIAGRPADPTGPLTFARLARRTIGGDRAAAVILARAVLADPAAAAVELGRTLAAADRRQLLVALSAVADHLDRGPRAVGGSATAPPDARKPWPARLPPARPIRASRSWTARLERVSRGVVRAVGRSDAVPRVASPGQGVVARRRRGAGATMPDPRLVSTVAGLGLLWPWLTVHLEGVVERLARLDPIDARRLALAVLVPDAPASVDDPVVRLLAGDDLGREPSVIVVSDADLELAGHGSAAVLDAFAAVLPGFAGSSAAFVRREFLERRGLVDPAGRPVIVTIEPRPLDPVLARLPYPIASFALPWTPPLAIRLERA